MDEKTAIFLGAVVIAGAWYFTRKKDATKPTKPLEWPWSDMTPTNTGNNPVADPLEAPKTPTPPTTPTTPTPLPPHSDPMPGYNKP